MARNPRSGDGSAPAIGELISEAGGGSSMRRHPAPDQMTQETTDGTHSRDMAARNAEAIAAASSINSGRYHSGLDGADAPSDPTGYLTGGGSAPSPTSWADPSSLSQG